MKKTYILTALLLLLAVLFVGCGTDSDQTSLPSSELSAQETGSLESSSISNVPETQKSSINVFVPSSMTLMMNDLIETFEKTSDGLKVIANYSDSAALGEQIQNNADCDIFICEDPAVLDQLADGNIFDKESRAAFSDRELVLITTKGEATAEARAFYEFLLSEKAAEIMKASFDNGGTVRRTGFSASDGTLTAGQPV